MYYLTSLSSTRLFKLLLSFGKSLLQKSEFKSEDLISLAQLWEYPNYFSYNSELDIKLSSINAPNQFKILIRIISELSKRQGKYTSLNQIKLVNPRLIYNRFSYLACSKIERLLLICVDSQYKILNIREIAKGNEFQIALYFPYILKSAIKKTSFGFFLIHNHPSGDCKPSENDLSFTKKLNQASEILGLKLIDHLIIGKNYYSFKEKGLL